MTAVDYTPEQVQYLAVRVIAANDQVWDRCDLDEESGCLNWTGCTNSKGYGVVSVQGKRELTHRVAYEGMFGFIPDGLQLDHLCRNKICANPFHLEAVTSRENNNRKPQQTQCPNGHDWIAENLNVRTRKNGHVQRECRLCAQEKRRERTARETAARRAEKAALTEAASLVARARAGMSS